MMEGKVDTVSISVFFFLCCLGFFSISLVNLLRLRKERRKILQIKDELQNAKDYISAAIESMLDTFVFINAEGLPPNKVWFSLKTMKVGELLLLYIYPLPNNSKSR